MRCCPSKAGQHDHYCNKCTKSFYADSYTDLPTSHLPPPTPTQQPRLIKTKYISTEFTSWTQTFNLHCLKFHSGWSLDSVGL